jgi:hypothetical protein
VSCTGIVGIVPSAPSAAHIRIGWSKELSMNLNSTRTSNITGLAIYPMFVRVFLQALGLALDPDNRAREKKRAECRRYTLIS